MEGKEKRSQYIVEGNRLVRVIESFSDWDLIVPKGVEIVGAKASYGSHQSRIILPESLKRIESEAFASMNEIEHPVHIPAGVEYIAYDAFGDDRYEPELRFTVDPRNPFYYAENGILYEKKPSQQGVYDEREALLLADPEDRARVKEWDIVVFGRFPQTEDGRDLSPLEWLVLSVKGGEALLLSRYALDTMPYDDAGYEGITWENCTMRKWLNDSFYSAAFSGTERDLILPTEGVAGDECVDRIFALSKRETEDLFRNRHTGRPDFISGMVEYDDQNARRCRITAYAAAKARKWNDELSEGDYGRWLCCDYHWQHGCTQAFSVTADGDHVLWPSFLTENFVRPAMRVSLG